MSDSPSGVPKHKTAQTRPPTHLRLGPTRKGQTQCIFRSNFKAKFLSQLQIHIYTSTPLTQSQTQQPSSIKYIYTPIHIPIILLIMNKVFSVWHIQIIYIYIYIYICFKVHKLLFFSKSRIQDSSVTGESPFPRTRVSVSESQSLCFLGDSLASI